jgi:hypothetical protein
VFVTIYESRARIFFSIALISTRVRVHPTILASASTQPFSCLVRPYPPPLASASNPLSTRISQPSSPLHPPPPQSETLARVLPAITASVDQDCEWRLPATSGPRQRVSTARSAPCATTPLRHICVLAGHGAPSRPDLSSLAPKLLPPLLLRLPPSPPLHLFDARDGKLAGDRRRRKLPSWPWFVACGGGGMSPLPLP